MTENKDAAGQGDEMVDVADRDDWRALLHERVLARTRATQASWPRGIKLGAASLAVLAHLLLGLWLGDLMRTHPSMDGDRIAVRLIETLPPEPALPEPPLAPPRIYPPARVGRTRAPAATASSAPSAPASLPALHLYNPDGSIALPSANNDAMTASVAPDAFVAQAVARSKLMLPHRPLKIRPNHFANAWKGGGNVDLFDRLNELIDKNLTVKKELFGGAVKCQATYLLVIAVGACGWGFPPPPGGRPIEHWKPATELDER